MTIGESTTMIVPTPARLADLTQRANKAYRPDTMIAWLPTQKVHVAVLLIDGTRAVVVAPGCPLEFRELDELIFIHPLVLHAIESLENFNEREAST